mmetsp:Transcript_3524/g.3698  ORF Transcript_3524/g.3698 Transcript_3524/m.3698 type:complete len:238 (+) Transcript_3524:311-1024(+)
MKVILAFLFLSCASAVEKKNLRIPLENKLLLPLVPGARVIGNEICISEPEKEYVGQAVLIDTDNSAGFIPTQGDISMANALTPASGQFFPSIKALCTITALNPSDSPPFCTLETTFGGGKKIMAMGTPPDLVVMGGTGEYSRASGTMTTARDFVRDSDRISFNARIDFCYPNPTGNPTGNPCEDDPSWYTIHKGRKKGCAWAGNDAKPSRCSKTHPDTLETANIACPISCEKCPELI